MKKAGFLLLVLVVLSGCSIKKVAFNATADMLAPPPGKVISDDEPNPMTALTGENDPELVAAFFPTALKLYEIMHLQNPEHENLAIMTGQLYIMYANAFVQSPAEQLPFDEFDRQNREYERAQNFYMRGRSFILKALDHRYDGFSDTVFGPDAAQREQLLASCEEADTSALFWAASGLFGAFSLSPMDTSYHVLLAGSLAMIEKAAELDPAYNNGSLWEILMAFYAAAPESLGGGRDKALAAYEKALYYSGGKSPSTHTGYVRSFCIPSQDSEGFDENIDKALAIDPDDQPDNRLAVILAQRQARWLKANKGEFILE